MEEFDDFGGFNPGGSPLNLRQQRKVVNDLDFLSGDPMRHEVRDLDYDIFVGRQFAAAYAGNSPVPRANVETVYVSKPETRFFDLARPVGPGQANTMNDVASAKNVLSSLGFARFDLAKERSTEPTPNFFNRIRRAQNALGESIDGIMNPGGATITALKDSREGKRPTGFDLGALKTAAAGRNAALTKPGASGGSANTVPPGVLDNFQRRGLESIAGKSLKPPLPPVTHRQAERESMDKGPVVNLSKDRIRAIIDNRRARFEISDDSTEKGERPSDFELHSAGRDAVKRFDIIVVEEAKRQGVDPDLVRAIMYVENARGWYDTIHPWRNSERPMNINPKLWKGLGGINLKNAADPRINVRAGVTLIKRLIDRVDSPNARKIAALYHFTGQEKTSADQRGYAARVAYVYRKKLWLRPPKSPLRDPNLAP